MVIVNLVVGIGIVVFVIVFLFYIGFGLEGVLLYIRDNILLNGIIIEILCFID